MRTESRELILKRRSLTQNLAIARNNVQCASEALMELVVQTELAVSGGESGDRLVKHLHAASAHLHTAHNYFAQANQLALALDVSIEIPDSSISQAKERSW